MDKEYRPVWQTWSLSRPRAPTQEPLNASMAERVELRQMVQRARIEQRRSVADLAARVQCDVETLAAFERGDEILGADVQKRLRAVLEL